MPYPTETMLFTRSWFGQVNHARGITEAVLRFLDHQGVELTPAAREHVTACTDLDLARTWLDESVTATVQAELTGLDEL